MAIIVNLDVMMAKRKISLGELANKIGITQANLSILKTGKAKAIRFSTLNAICSILDCQPADILGQNECIICSQVTDNSAMIVASMQAVIDGTFGGATLYGTLQNNTLSAGALSDLVPADVQEKYLAYIDQMIAGTFMQ